MTLGDVQRAALALYAARAAGKGGSLEQMLAICYCIRNRVWAGWYDNWLTVIEHAGEAAGNTSDEVFCLDSSSRTFQRLLTEVDDIYFGGRLPKPNTPQHIAQQFTPEPGSMADTFKSSLYWLFLNRPIRPWFQQKIINNPEAHPQRTTLGTMLFFE